MRIYFLPLQAALERRPHTAFLNIYQNLLLLDPVEVAVPEAELDVAVDEEEDELVEEELPPEVAINGPMVRFPQGG